MMMVKIINANPRTVAIWRGKILLETLRSREDIMVVLSDDLMASYERYGKVARVVCQAHSADDEEDWILEVGHEKVRIVPPSHLAFEAEASRPET